MNTPANPFAALSLIGAPAILTNACAVLILSTSNRLARSVDRARILTAQIDAGDTEETGELVGELHIVAQRAVILMRALRLFYGALGSFAASAFVSLFGAVLVTTGPELLVRALEVTAVLVGLGAVGSLISGSVLLIRETRMAVALLQEQAVALEARIEAARERSTAGIRSE
jgi:hypothetical protein